MTAPMLSKTDAWTIEDLQALPDDGRRYEIVEGTLLVRPPATNRHQGVASRLAWRLNEACPAGYTVLTPGTVQLGSSMRVPDIVVVQDAALREGAPLAAAPGEVLLAVEVMSPGSVHEDTVSKPAQYAAAGIAHYWRFDPQELGSLHIHRLVPSSSTYVEWDTAVGDQMARVTEPFPVEFAPADLLP